MRLGCFGKIEQIEDIEQAGFQCAELDICEIVSLSDMAFEKLKVQVKKKNLKFDVFSGLLPLNIRICEKEFDTAYWLRHIEKGAQRISELGAELVPFGAGKCRSIPDDVSEEKYRSYYNQLLEFIRKICDVLSAYKIQLVIEPLGKSNSNFLNFIREADVFCRQVKRKNCAIMCDFRHMVSNGESPDEIKAYRENIKHAHIDYPLGNKRRFPRREDGCDYLPYLRALVQSGYMGRLTVEATDYEEFAKETMESAGYLRELLCKAHMEI